MNTPIKQIEDIILPYCAGLLTLLCIPIPRIINAIDKLYNTSSNYLISNTVSAWLIILSLSITCIVLMLAKLTRDNILWKKTCNFVILGSWFSLFSIWLSDICWMGIKLVIDTQSSITLSSMLINYTTQEKWIYFTLIGMVIVLNYLYSMDDDNKTQNLASKQSAGVGLKLLSVLMPVSVIIIPISLNLNLFFKTTAHVFLDLSSNLKVLLNIIYIISSLTIISIGIYRTKLNKINQQTLLQIIHVNGVTCICMLLFQVLSSILPIYNILNYSLSDKLGLATNSFKTNLTTLLLNLALFIVLVFIQKYYKKKQFITNNPSDQTTGNFGTAAWADEPYLKEQGFYNVNGTLIGVDKDNAQLKYPICNRTIIANSGGGKTSSCLIPALLTEDRSVFCFDPKAELWAVTAKQRAFGFGRTRKVVTIDPFQVIQKHDLSKNKPRELRKIYKINPLDYISDEPRLRDRQLTNIAQSCVVRDEKLNIDPHWYDYAEIFIKGLIEYILDTQKTEKVNLITVRECLVNNKEHMTILMDAMYNLGGKHAKTTAGMLQNVGDEERSGIWSTTYRQLSWAIDANVIATFSESNIDLRDFIKGDMDIFVILPEDQIREHSRAIRLIFTSIINILSQTEPSQLPKQKFLFILEELGQLGTSQDVERAIEILRYKQVILWSIFQNYGQIKLYQKPENFTESQIKQFFSTDDISTMEWIQKLAGQKTVKVTSLAQNTNISSHHSNLLSSNVSSGDNINVQETGVPLLHLNQIREMDQEFQLVFVKSVRPIMCKRIFYYKDAYLNSIADPNPYVNIDN